MPTGSCGQLTERPVGHSQTALEFLRLKRQALKDLLEYFRHAGVYGQPELPATNLAVNNMTVVPLERLTDEELEFYRVVAEKDERSRSTRRKSRRRRRREVTKMTCLMNSDQLVDLGRKWVPARESIDRLPTLLTCVRPEFIGRDDRNNLEVNQVVPSSRPRGQSVAIRCLHHLKASPG